jgi:uncharacterized membrane protein YecN with MAPEG domain
MITLLYACILGLLSVLLANQVLYVRLRGDKEESWRADSVLRVQANFVENVPLALIILYLFETVSAGYYIIHIFGVALVIFRLLHAWGLGNNQGANYPRLIGAQGTFLLISIMSVAGIYLFFSS